MGGGVSARRSTSTSTITAPEACDGSSGQDRGGESTRSGLQDGSGALESECSGEEEEEEDVGDSLAEYWLPPGSV